MDNIVNVELSDLTNEQLTKIYSLKEQQHNNAVNEFIAARTREEQLFTTIAEEMRHLPDDILQRLPVVEHEISLRGFVPEYYEEHVNREKAAEQVAKCNEWIDVWNKIALENLAAGVNIQQLISKALES